MVYCHPFDTTVKINDHRLADGLFFRIWAEMALAMIDNADRLNLVWMEILK